MDSWGVHRSLEDSQNFDSGHGEKEKEKRGTKQTSVIVNSMSIIFLVINTPWRLPGVMWDAETLSRSGCRYTAYFSSATGPSGEEGLG